MWRTNQAGKGRQTCECELASELQLLLEPSKSSYKHIQCSLICLQRSCSWIDGNVEFAYIVPTKQEIIDRRFTLRVFERGTDKQVKSAKFDPGHFKDDDSMNKVTMYTMEGAHNPHENVRAQ